MSINLKKINVSRYFLICAIFIGAAAVGGLLIIRCTPYFYSFHPYAIHEEAKDSTETVIYTLEDKITISHDSVISRMFTISEPPQSHIETKPTMENLGTFGDSAGFWNAIFSALAMIGVIYTIFYQIKRDRDNDERVAIAQFQDQFFKMISILSEIVSELRIPQNDKPGFNYDIPPNAGYQLTDSDPDLTPMNPVPTQTVAPKDIVGRACFQYIYKEKEGGLNIGEFIVSESGGNQNAIASEQLYDSIRKIIGTYFDHYFRTVYRILKFIDDIDLGNCAKSKQAEVKDLCSDLLRAQLSAYELAMLYYNGLIPQFRNTSKKLYETYCIFNNLDPKILILQSEKDYYEYVCSNRANKEDYNASIHYDFTAFTSPNKSASPNSVTSNNQRNSDKSWRLILKYPFKLLRKSPQSSVQTQVNVNENMQKIFNFIKEKGNKSITYQEFATEGITKDQVKNAVELLKAYGYISIKNRQKGKKYTILKDYP